MMISEFTKFKMVEVAEAFQQFINQYAELVFIDIAFSTNHFCIIEEKTHALH